MYCYKCGKYIDEMRTATQKMISYFGADDYESFVLTFAMPNGTEWALCLGAFKYGDKWYADHDSYLAKFLWMSNYFGISLLSDLDK